MKLTKLDMARVIVSALYNMKSLPAPDHHEVVRYVRRCTAAQLREQHIMALRVIERNRSAA